MLKGGRLFGRSGLAVLLMPVATVVVHQLRRRYMTARGKKLRDELTTLPGNDEFQESNLMHSINGYVYVNGPMMKCTSASGSGGT